jgi:UDPglucose 6-dehydrogenase
MKIAIVGTGYVGLSLATLISKKYEVIALDIDTKKVELINKKISPIKDKEIEDYLLNKKLKLKATISQEEAFLNADIIIIATPTNYDHIKDSFDTSSVEDVIGNIQIYNKTALIVIKSTIPIGFTDKIRSKYKNSNIIFSPEFLRESKALYDNLFPARIVIGGTSEVAQEFAKILVESAIKNKDQIPVLFMSSKEAEAVKLFSNTYLAMRVAFFNELDSFSESNKLNTKKIIEGVSLDNRVGNFYNNPSFGYGGYCLPKDSKQLLTNYKDIPNKIITAVVESNQTRKEFIANSILSRSPKIVGIYRLIMKEGSDNFRESAILDIIDMLLKNDISIVVYEPLVKNLELNKASLINNLDIFTEKSDLILANRMTKELENFKDKVYSRDLFKEN